MGSLPNGFAYAVQQQGAVVVIRHHRRAATALRGATATRFLADLELGDPQQLMARVTGNYKRGNARR